MKKLLLLSIVMLAAIGVSQAQVSIGADVVSQYVWRGVPQTAAAYQPSLSYTFSGFTIGAWASTSIAGGAYENDLYLGYSGESFGITLTDYYYPGAGGKNDFLSFDSDTGAHTLELSGYWTISDFKLLVAANVFASKAWDPDQSAYAEISYMTKSGDIDLTYTAGGAFKFSNDENVTSDWYALTTPKGKKESFGLTNLSVTASKSVAITDKFSLPVYGTFTLNAYSKVSYFVLGFKI